MNPSRHQALSFDVDLLQRYSGPGPRYTSYPAAPQFTEGFGETQLREHLRRSNLPHAPRDLSLYVHVPFCSSPCFYCGCNRIITRDAKRGSAYVNQLEVEIQRMGSLMDRGRQAVQLHFGGGTPNFLGSMELARALNVLSRYFHLSCSVDRDFSIEIDPRFLGAGDIATYAALGFNRASFGVQDFDPAVQRAVNRIQSVEETAKAIESCRASGFKSVNVDLMYGLPLQTLETFAQTLDTVIGLKPDRLAVYGYAHMPNLFKPQKLIREAEVPDLRTRLALLELAIGKLSSAGYRYIGMDHFALPDDPLCQAQDAASLHRNFMGYTTHADCDLIGLGVSAISHIGHSFSQNFRDLKAWSVALDAERLPVWRGMTLDADDIRRADAIQQLMCQGAVDVAELEVRYALDFPAYFSETLKKLQPLISDGLVTACATRIAATARGRLLLRNVAMCFDRYVGPQAAATTPLVRRFSNAI